MPQTLKFVALASALAALCSTTQATPPARTVALADVSQPIAIASTPADAGFIYVCERPGVIVAIDANTGALAGNPVLDITPQVSLTIDNGLLGLAFDPGYATNRYFYTYHIDLANDAVLTRYQMQTGSRIADTASATVIWRYPRPLGHNGGWIGFSPINNLLYITSGDGDTGGSPDPANRAQTLTNQPMGKILRIDPSTDGFPADPNRNYAIPPSNPFVGITGDDEIWAYGVRNPWRASFDRLTGDFYFGDVGADSWEEVNFEPSSSPGGRNYGWACMEGTHCTIATPCICNDPSLTLPVYDYPHPAGTAVTGGYVYRGSAIPSLQGAYFFADLFRSKIWTMRVGPGGAISDFADRSLELTPAAVSAPINFIATFGEGPDGELYIANLFLGKVYKVVPYPCAPIIDQSPLAQTIRAGSSTSLRVFGAGADPLTYQWQKNGVDLVNDGRVTGVTTHTLSISSLLVSDTGAYTAVLRSPCGPDATSVPAVLTVFTCSSADINNSGTLTVQDIFDFLTAYFSALPAGDFNGNGSISVQDIFDFLSAYFAGCV